MAGFAKTDNFLLSTATVMIGLPAELNDLNPDDHAIGLVKNFTFTSDPAYTELTQGAKGSIVFSTLTSNPVKATMEAYEYTAPNLLYSLGLDGSQASAPATPTTLTASVSASPAVNSIHVTSATGMSIGKYVLIEVDAIDDFIVRKITGVASLVITLDHDLPAIPNGAKVTVVNAIDVGSKDEQPFFSAKIAGKLANGEDVVVLLPKIRITKGFNLAFVTNDYGNLPFEFTIYDLVTTDPFYADYKTANARLFRR